MDNYDIAMWFGTWGNVLIIFAMCGALFWLVFTTNENTAACTALLEYGDKASLFEDKVLEKAKYIGLYTNDKGYCVWTKGMKIANAKQLDPSLVNINMTAIHEYCHAIIVQNYGCQNVTCHTHFCED